jgi:hypothetical protein
VWPYVTSTFGLAVPTKVTVRYSSRRGEYFHPDDASIEISSADHHTPRELGLVAHETAHLALASLSNGASTLEGFRFMDEGLAAIIEESVRGTLPTYRRAALVLAARRISTGGARLADLQVWSRYFGDPARDAGKSADYDAYLVGSAFDFFLEDVYGEGALKRLFLDLSKTRSLPASLTNVFGRTVEQTEAAWDRYLRAVDLSIATHVPSVVAMDPTSGASGVPTATTEIHVAFDTDMLPFICVDAPCSAGICYDHAYWQDTRTLAIRIDGRLLPDHAYSLSLGSPPQCLLKSIYRVEMPVVRWEFRTR